MLKNKFIAFLLFTYFFDLNKSFTQNSFTLKLVDRITLYFESNRFELDQEEKSKIKTFIDHLDKIIPYQFKVQAHTDSIGSIHYNKKLSESRAQLVITCLIDNGVPEKLCSDMALGESKPIMSNVDEDGRAYNRRCNVFVFRVEKMRLFKSKIILEDSKKNAEIMVYIYLKNQIDSVKASKNGDFAFIVPENEKVTYGVFAKNHMFETREISTAYDLPVGDIYLNKIKKGSKVLLNNLYFVGDQPILLEESIPELKNLLRFLNMNKNVKIEIGGHVNGPKANFGDPNWYDNLARRRTEAIRDFVVDKGVDTKNIVCKSYSNHEMIFQNPRNEKEAKMNRRVEIKILDF